MASLIETILTAAFLAWAYYAVIRSPYGKSTNKIVLISFVCFGILMILLLGEESVWTKLIK